MRHSQAPPPPFVLQKLDNVWGLCMEDYAEYRYQFFIVFK